MGKQKPPEVLVVEDEFSTRMVAADAISDMGLPALEACDADEALQALEDHPDIGVLFTDIHMPGSTNGLSLAKQVHQERPNVDLIVTSGGTKVKDSASLMTGPSFLSLIASAAWSRLSGRRSLCFHVRAGEARLLALSAPDGPYPPCTNCCVQCSQ